MRATEHLVSAATLRGHLEQVREREAEHRRFRADGAGETKVADWILAEWEAAIDAAEAELVGLSRAAELTGWHADTLRRHARAVWENKPVPATWRALDVRRQGEAGDWLVRLASVPVCGKAAA